MIELVMHIFTDRYAYCIQDRVIHRIIVSVYLVVYIYKVYIYKVIDRKNLGEIYLYGL